MSYVQPRFFKEQIQSIAAAKKRINLWHGPVRSGKTWSSLYKWIEYVKYGPRGPLFLIGKTERTLKRNIIDPLIDVLGPSCRHVRGVGELYIGNRRIDLIGANDVKSESKIRGATVAGAYGDEITLWPQEVFKQLLARMSVDGAQLFGTTNTDNPYHWLKTDYIDRQSELDMVSFHWPLDCNVRPDGFLNKTFVDNLKKEYTGLWYKRFIEGLWVLAEGVIYDMWDEDKYLVDVQDNNKYRNFIVSVDYGTANPCTFGLYGWNKPSNIILLSEYYYDSRKTVRAKTDSQYADDFDIWLQKTNIPRSKIQAVYVDPSALSFKAILAQDGWPVQDADNSVLDGIRYVGTKLSNDEFKIDYRCRNTVAEFGAYCWDEKAQEKGEDKPIKDHDHCMDRNRYALFSHFGPKRKRVGVWGAAQDE